MKRLLKQGLKRRLGRLPSARTLILMTGALILLAACQPSDIPGPTPIPTLAASRTPSPSPSPVIFADTVTPTQPPPPTGPALLPMISATPPVAQISELGGGPVAAVPTQPAPVCFKARAGDSLIALAYRGGYTDLSVLPAVRALNNMCPTCNDIQVGREYCIPRPTPTPTPQGGEATAVVRATELAALPTRGFSILKYKVKSDDNIISLQLRTGASLRDICTLNEGVINCAGCQLDKPIGEQGCRPIVVEGAEINVPGPPPTATITPTFTGLETTTPTPQFAMPRVISPVDGEVRTGIVQLLWLPVALLGPDEFYLLTWSNQTTGQTWQETLQTNTYRFPESFIPGPGQTQTVFWRVDVARYTQDRGGYILVSPEGLIHSFLWQGQ